MKDRCVVGTLLAAFMIVGFAPVGAQQVGAASVAARSEARFDSAAILARPVTIRLRRVSLERAIVAVAAAGHVNVQYWSKLLDAADRPTSVDVDRQPLGQVFADLLAGTQLGLVLLGPDLVGIRSLNGELPQQVGAIVGTVTDRDGKRPVAGATVALVGLDRHVRTDADGKFRFAKIPDGAYAVTVRRLGYEVATQKISVDRAATVTVAISLVSAATVLNEVVTTVTGPQRRLEMGNDITTINADSIVRTAPIMSVTNLLEGRVPGLVVMHTSGTPGAPSRIRLRGSASISENNDPIVIVDGVRVYSSQSDLRNLNLGAIRYDSSANQLRPNLLGNVVATPAPSPLDEIDPNTIATIDVMKGPAAATLYGSDAANGVIVITTKRGQAGPTRWSLSGVRGTTYIPGNYPDAVWRWGHDIVTGASTLCLIFNTRCAVDSVLRYQALNHSELTPLGHGRNTSVTGSVSGGANRLQYSLTGSLSDELGVLKMPDRAIADYRSRLSAEPPGWMRRPDNLQSANGSLQLATQFGDTRDVTMTTSVSHQTQQTGGLSGDLALIQRTFVNSVTGQYWQSAPIVLSGSFLAPVVSAAVLAPNLFVRTTDEAVRTGNRATGNWRITPWFSTGADVGLDVLNRNDRSSLARGLTVGTGDSTGWIREGRGQSMVKTVNVRSAMTSALPIGGSFTLSFGANYFHSSTSDVYGQGTGLVAGRETLSGASDSYSFEDAGSNATFGYYVEPRFAFGNLFISPGIRADAGSTYGSGAKLFVIPKVNVSWILSEEPFFAPMRHLLNTVRLRMAYGQAGVQPGLTERLRTFQSRTGWLDGQVVQMSQLNTLGNTTLQPERSRELELGGDADFFNNRLSLSVTQYVKTRTNAITTVTPPQSVDGLAMTQQVNVGQVRNAGTELSATVNPVRTALVDWNAQVTYSQNRNRVVKLGPAIQSFIAGDSYDQRIAVGYPLFGLWARPIVGYSDVNDNGVIEPNEVQVGDTKVYMGASTPDNVVSIHTTLSLFGGRVTTGANLMYQGGFTQVNSALASNAGFSPTLNDPATPFGQQAAIAALNQTSFGMIQTVSTLRLNSLSVAYRLPGTIARLFRSTAMSMAIQGTNLGLRTNYVGKDPAVNAYGTGNDVRDSGVLPEPRTWQLRVNVGY